MTTEAMTTEIALPSASETRTQMQAITAFQQACQQHMVKDHDYGVIPGTRGKPTLLKPGAEKIIRLLGLADAISPPGMWSLRESGSATAWRRNTAIAG